MIHDCLITGNIALRYYKIVHPERDYDENNRQASRQILQDKRIDKAILKKVIDQISKEAKKNINKL